MHALTPTVKMLYGKLLDPFGYTWSIAHTLHAPHPEQMRRDAEASFAQAGLRHPTAGSSS